ncbi:hypothetical protein FGB62_204g17 [Gracilaria domingensis]|nr:hypothetical protein FGB62_204g17 [Gracilaria domingensis]
MGTSNPSLMSSIVAHARKAKEDLLPMDIDDSDQHQVLSAVLAWRAQCRESFFENPQEEDDQLKSNLGNNFIVPQDPRNCGNDFILASTRENGVVTQIGGVPLPKPATEESYQSLHDAGKMRPRHRSRVPPYNQRDIATPILARPHVLGRTLIMEFFRRGQTVERYMDNLDVWKSPKKSPQTEQKARHIASYLHNTILEYKGNVNQALSDNHWMEIAIRRLFCVVNVEQDHQSNPALTRSAHWINFEHLLEVSGSGRLTSVYLSQYLNRYAIQFRKAAAAMQSNAKTRSRRNASKRDNNKRDGPGTSDQKQEQ